MKSFEYTDKGKSRTENQDAYYSFKKEEIYVYIVADGMGGHRKGEFASNLTVNIFKEEIEKNFEQIKTGELPVAKFIKDTVERANKDIYNISKKEIENGTIGTTIVILVVKDDKAYIGHIGDSRAYLIRERMIQKLTIDHSLVEALVKSGSITREEARVHPQRNIITKAVGTNEDIDIEIKSFELEKEDIILLSTDGLHGVLNEDYIIDKINETPEDLDGVCKDLIYEANELGGPDNITILMIKKN